MKIYQIKTSEFKNLQKKESVLDKNIQNQITSIEKSTSKTINKVLIHGKNIVLCITSDSKYLIPAKPCYQKSLVDILTSVDINTSDIIILRKSSAPCELTVDELKQILTSTK